MPASSACAKCGACSAVCPVYRVSGNEAHIARGRLHLLDVLGTEEAGREFIDIFSACLLCGACTAVCSRHIDITAELVKAREAFAGHAGPHGYEKYLTRKLLDLPFGLRSAAALGRVAEKLFASRLPQNSGLRLRLAMFSEENGVTASRKKKSVPDTGKRLNWFPGCTAEYLLPEIASGCEALLDDCGFTLVAPDHLGCCGLASWAAGDKDAARKSAQKNIKAFEMNEGDILVSCASCFVHLKNYPELFSGDVKWENRARQMAGRIREMSAFPALMQERGKEKREKRLRVFYHDPCHLRFGEKGADKSCELLRATGRTEILALPDGPRCCGQGGLFHVAHPDISASIRDSLVQDVLALEPDVVTTSCSGCLMQWQQGLLHAGSDVRVVHLATLLGRLRVE